jgi:CheY-like chemotaxis protein
VLRASACPGSREQDLFEPFTPAIPSTRDGNFRTPFGETSRFRTLREGISACRGGYSVWYGPCSTCQRRYADTHHLVSRGKKTGYKENLHFVCDGREAICYLAGEQQWSDRRQHPLPDLLLLDLKMPFKDGFDVLEWVRKQPGLRETTSQPGASRFQLNLSAYA